MNKPTGHDFLVEPKFIFFIGMMTKPGEIPLILHKWEATACQVQKIIDEITDKSDERPKKEAKRVSALVRETLAAIVQEGRSLAD